MTLNQLRYFCTACQYKSITKAADLLYVSQPAVSSAIRELEREYQLQLLTRKNKSFELTEDGTTFYQHALVLLQQAEQFSQQMHDLSQRLSNVSVGVTRTTSGSIYAKFFSYYSSYDSQISMQTVFGQSRQHIDRVRNGVLDIAFIANDTLTPDSGVEHRVITSIRFVCVMSENHPLAHCSQVNVPMICDEPMVTTLYDNTKHQDLLKIYGAYGKTPRVIQRFDQISSVISAVRNGTAIAYLPEDQVRDYKSLVCIPLEEGHPVDFALIWNKESARRPAVRTLIEMIFRCFEEITAAE